MPSLRTLSLTFLSSVSLFSTAFCTTDCFFLFFLKKNLDFNLEIKKFLSRKRYKILLALKIFFIKLQLETFSVFFFLLLRLFANTQGNHDFVHN